jgi:hypothetical protein
MPMWRFLSSDDATKNNMGFDQQLCTPVLFLSLLNFANEWPQFPPVQEKMSRWQLARCGQNAGGMPRSSS